MKRRVIALEGPKILFTIPYLNIRVTETVVDTWLVMAVITILCIWLTRGLEIVPKTKRQLAAEKLVSLVNNMVLSTMGHRYLSFAPYIAALFATSMIGSLSSLIGLRPLTADFSTTLAWALLAFIMIQGNNIRLNGVGGWLKGFLDPVPFMLPLNIVSEIANPISMSFRHFGNIAAGMVITSLLYSALAALSNFVLGWIPSDFVAGIPIFQLGLPAILSIYFDVFTSFLQAYIICMLTMVYVSGVDSRE